jgi:hypothetical protein
VSEIDTRIDLQMKNQYFEIECFSEFTMVPVKTTVLKTVKSSIMYMSNRALCRPYGLGTDSSRGQCYGSNCMNVPRRAYGLCSYPSLLPSPG